MQVKAQVASRRLAGALLAKVPPATVAYMNGTVASVTAGAAADGNAAVVVTVGDDGIPAPYLAAYTPVVGHMVRVQFVNGSPLIIGRVIGWPVF